MDQSTAAGRWWASGFWTKADLAPEDWLQLTVDSLHSVNTTVVISGLDSIEYIT